MGKGFWISVISLVILFSVFVVLNIWLEVSKPSDTIAMYSGRGETMYQEKLFNNYTCKDCIAVEVDGYYEFVFPNWKYNNSKLYVNISNVKYR